MATTWVKGSLCHKQGRKGNYQMLEAPGAPGQGLEKCLLSVSQKVPSNTFCSSGPRGVQSLKQKGNHVAHRPPKA